MQHKILSLIDLTSLNDNDTDAVITKLCQKAVTAYGHVAAVCVYPQFVKLAAQLLKETPVKIATVANFPQGNFLLPDVLSVIQKSIQDGAHEIDVVFPYSHYLNGDVDYAKEFIKKCKETCGNNITLKVILETGAFQDMHVLADAARDVLLSGADFLKTSTGKIEKGATPEAADVLLKAIKEYSPSPKRTVGFKASGGVRTIEQASQYIQIANDIMCSDWVSPKTFRLGASQLLDAVIAELK